jgi:hypothetical protein
LLSGSLQQDFGISDDALGQSVSQSRKVLIPQHVLL